MRSNYKSQPPSERSKELIGRFLNYFDELYAHDLLTWQHSCNSDVYKDAEEFLERLNAK